MITIKEHQKIEPELLERLDAESLKRRVSYDTSAFHASGINLMRYEFDPAAHKDGFYSYFRIGAEWIDEAETEALIVLPKIERIDFIGMLMACLRISLPEDRFSDIFDIDFEAKPIRSAVLSSILSPLLVVQFLMIVRRITERGLRKGYVAREENLFKVKGRIDFQRNERLNSASCHKERIYCRYDEFSVDTPENRYLKRALLIASGMISLMASHKSYTTLYALCNQCLSAFSNVSCTCAPSPLTTRSHKLYREYSDALRLASMIIRKEEMSVSSSSGNLRDMVPVFRIDMALLFEHYVLARLREHFGIRNVIYQAHGSNAFIADFLISSGKVKAIADSKYIPVSADAASAKGNYIKQLSGYARDKRLLHLIGINSAEEDSVPVVDCTLIYPSSSQQEKEFSLFSNKISGTVKFYTTAVSIPLV